MKIISNGDAYADALSTAALATIPFIAFGILRHPIVLYVSSALAILLSCCFLIRFFMTLKRPDIIKASEWMTDLMSLLELPYVFAVSALLLIIDRIDASIVIWLSLAVALLGAAWCFYDSRNPE